METLENSSFTPTHLLRGVLVRKANRQPTGTPRDHIPIYLDENGKEIKSGWGKYPTPIEDLERAKEEERAQEAEREAEEVRRLLSTPALPPSAPQPGETVLLDAELAAAALRAAAFPVYGQSIGHGDTASGKGSADLAGKLPDGSLRVRVCALGKRYVYVRIPRDIGFEVVEGD